MTELEKAKKKIIIQCIDAFAEASKRVGRDFDEPECLIIEDTVNHTFEQALKPEHMKLTDEVKGLIKALRYYIDTRPVDIETCLSSYKSGAKAIEALKPFEKEAGE